MVDVLEPLCNKFSEILSENKIYTPRQIGEKLLETAKLSAAEVINLKAQKGRARYLGGKEIG